MKKTKEPWQIVAARYCVENSEKGFNVLALKDYLKTKYDIQDRHFTQFIDEEIQLPSGRKFSRNAGLDNLWIPPLDLVSKITDYDELQEARRNSKSAFRLSLLAIAISVVSTAIGIVQIFMTQDVIVKNEILKAEIMNFSK